MRRIRSHWRLRLRASEPEFIYIKKEQPPALAEDQSPLEPAKQAYLFEFRGVSKKSPLDLESMFEEIGRCCRLLGCSSGREMLLQLAKSAPAPVFVGTPRATQETNLMLELLESRFDQPATNRNQSVPANPSTPQSLNLPKLLPIHLPVTARPIIIPKLQYTSAFNPVSLKIPQLPIAFIPEESESDKDEEYHASESTSMLTNSQSSKLIPDCSTSQLLNPSTPPSEPEELSYYNKKIIEDLKRHLAQNQKLLPAKARLLSQPPLKATSKPFFHILSSPNKKTIALPSSQPVAVVRFHSWQIDVACQIPKAVKLSIPKRIKYPTPRRIGRQAAKRHHHSSLKPPASQPLNSSTPQLSNPSSKRK